GPCRRDPGCGVPQDAAAGPPATERDRPQGAPLAGNAGRRRPAGRWTAGMKRWILLLLAVVALSQGLQAAGWSRSLQVTASKAKGLYLIRPAAPFERGDIVLLDPPAAVAPLMVGRGWLGADMKLLKPIAATAPDEVCLRDRQVFINGRALAPVFAVDRLGRPLPRPDLCRRLAPGEALLRRTRTPHPFHTPHYCPVAA